MHNSQCSTIEQYLDVLGSYYHMLEAKVPSFDEYWESLEKEARTEYRSAQKKGYTLRRNRFPNIKDLLPIYESKSERQGRAINYVYTDLNFAHIDVRKGWPVPDYMPSCNEHHLEFYEVMLGDELVAFAEIVRCGDILNIHMAMAKRGHRVMKWMFLEILKDNPWCKRFVYGDADFLKDNRRFFVQNLRITEPFKYAKKRKAIALDCDDLEFVKSESGMEQWQKIKDHYPDLKVTMFMVPMATSLLQEQVTFDEYKVWAKWLKEQDWIQVAPHGFTHVPEEMLNYTTQQGRRREVDYETANILIDASEKMFRELDLPFVRVWKSPFWQSSPETLRALWDRGYTIAVDRNQEIPVGGPVYIFNWSYDEPFPDNLNLVKGHGHMYPPSANDVHSTLPNILTMPTDYDFKFVSEVL